MGGIGSGNRWRLDARSTTDDFRGIDIRQLARRGVLRPGFRGSWIWSRRGKQIASVGIRTEADRLWLTYRAQQRGSEPTDHEYAVQIERTSCHLGGTRPWLVCPAVGCGRRVVALYGGTVFACRHCHRLAYASTREVAYDRAAHRADTIRERLGWAPGILNGAGLKPKWMRWRTFSRLALEHERLVRQSLAGMASRFKRIGEKPPF